MVFRVLRNFFPFFFRRRRLNYFRVWTMGDQVVEDALAGDEKTPEDMNTVYVDKTPYTKVTEGKADVLFPSSHDVFYNPVQEFNRDLSVAVMKLHIKMIPSMDKGIYVRLLKKKAKIEINVLEALSASGLRSIRYAKEVPGLTKVFANDISKLAYECIGRNVKHNQVEDVVVPTNEDAVIYMYKNRKSFDVIDLDPYGTATPFLDAAVQSVADGGLLMVTCTDVASLCGNGVEACRAKYGSVSLKIPSCHEMALRILLQCIESTANRYSRYIEPVLSLSIDFYVRVFVRVFAGAAIAKRSIGKLSMVYLCEGCKSFHFQKLGNVTQTDKSIKFSPGLGPPVDKRCSNCQYWNPFKVGGPIWTGNLHDKTFVRSLLLDISGGDETLYNTKKRMIGMLHVVEEELDDCPLFYTTDALFRAVSCPAPKLVQFKSALLNAGYKVSTSHCMPTSIKTDAPNEVVWDVVREWVKTNGSGKTFEDVIPRAIMSKESSITVSFEERPDANPRSRTDGICRFQQNPMPFWGPKSRSQTSLFFGKEREKQEKFQGKRKKKNGKKCESEEAEKEDIKKTKLEM